MQIIVSSVRKTIPIKRVRYHNATKINKYVDTCLMAIIKNVPFLFVFLRINHTVCRTLSRG